MFGNDFELGRVKVGHLKVTNLNIGEDYYVGSGAFQLKFKDKSCSVDLMNFGDEKANEIKKCFGLTEPVKEIKDTVMQKVVESAQMGCRIVEGDSNRFPKFSFNTKIKIDD